MCYVALHLCIYILASPTIPLGQSGIIVHVANQQRFYSRLPVILLLRSACISNMLVGYFIAYVLHPHLPVVSFHLAQNSFALMAGADFKTYHIELPGAASNGVPAGQNGIRTVV